MADIIVRRAERKDIPAMAGVVSRSWREAYKELISDEDMKLFANEPRRRDIFENRIDRDTFIYVIWSDNTVKGVCSAEKYEKQGFENTAEIDQLYLEPSEIGTGMGGMLFDYVLDDLKKSGFHRVVLFVMEGNDRAIGFYRHKGFSPDGFFSVCENLSRKNHGLRYIKEL